MSQCQRIFKIDQPNQRLKHTWSKYQFLKSELIFIFIDDFLAHFQDPFIGFLCNRNNISLGIGGWFEIRVATFSLFLL